MLGRVSFFSRTQKRVTLSSAEAEDVALAAGIKETIFSSSFFHGISGVFISPDRDVGCTLVKEDNVGAVHLPKNPATTPNSKHIDIIFVTILFGSVWQTANSR